MAWEHSAGMKGGEESELRLQHYPVSLHRRAVVVAPVLPNIVESPQCHHLAIAISSHLGTVQCSSVSNQFGKLVETLDLDSKARVVMQHCIVLEKFWMKFFVWAQRLRGLY